MLWRFAKVTFVELSKYFSSNPCYSFVAVETIGEFLQIMDCYSGHSHDVQSFPRALPSVTFIGGNFLPVYL